MRNMATTVRDFTNNKTGKKPITFIREAWTVSKYGKLPSDFQNIDLMCRNYIEGMDLMLAYDNGNNTRACILGFFNDGVVE